MKERPYLRLWENISESKCMAFISGPRQAGKKIPAQAVGAAIAIALISLPTTLPFKGICAAAIVAAAICLGFLTRFRFPFRPNAAPPRPPPDWPSDGLQKLGSCPVCQSPRRQTLYEGLTDRTFFCAPGSWTLHQCSDCGCAYLDPRPAPEAISLAYSSYFTHDSSNGRDTANLSGLAFWRRAFDNSYVNWRFGTRFHPVAPIWGRILVSIIPFERAKLEAEGRNLPKPKDGSRLLDVGCGNGAFLTFARSMGYDTMGTDVDPKALDIARSQGLRVFQGSVDDLSGFEAAFDVITLCHVIEHVHDPTRLLRRCRELLKPGGFLWIDTPNIDSQGHRIYGAHWRGLEPPRHLVVFSWASLEAALRQADFGRIERLPWQPSCAGMFMKSEVIRSGNDPRARVNLSFRDRARGLAPECRALLNPSVRETIGLRAWS